MAAPELETRPSPPTEGGSSGQPELVEQSPTAEVSGEVGEFIKPSNPPVSQMVTDKGQTVLSPAGAAQTAYSDDQIKQGKKASVSSGKRWLAVLFDLLNKRFAFLKLKTSG